MKTNKQNTTTLGGGGVHNSSLNLNTVSPELNSHQQVTESSRTDCGRAKLGEKFRTKLFLITLTLIFAVSSCGVKVGTGTGGGSNSLTLQQIIESGNLGAVAGNTDPLVTDTLSHLTANYFATITAIYVTETGSGDYSGTNWTNALAATNLRSTINNITNASATKVYAVLVAGGTYKPTIDTDRSISFSMKNHVAVIGGFSGTTNWQRTGTTFFSGDIGTANDNSDNTHQVFNNDGLDRTAVLYGVTISDGRANGGSSLKNGGGMYNSSSSPRLFNVMFAGNSATEQGGGMFNKSSSPQLFNVVFTGNSAAIYGGGMNNHLSSPQLFNVVFTGNSAAYNGGGMYNYGSSPVLTSVVFRSNTAAQHGGGMYNSDSSPRLFNMVFTGNSTAKHGGGMYNAGSSPVLIGAVFMSNVATQQGGGMYNYNGSNRVPLLVNAVFAGNTAAANGGQDIAMNLDFPGGTIRIAGSVLGVGLANATNGVVGTNTTVSLNLAYHSLANGAVNFGDNMTTGRFAYPTIQSGSGAKDLGLYVRRSGTDYYFSENNATWYTNFTATGGFGTAVPLPGGAEDLTATDIAGNPRVGRPDAGVYEVQ